MAAVSFGGLASGIDSAGIIQALLGQQRSTRIGPLETKIERFSETNDSLSKLSELLSKLSSAADKFRTVNGGGVAKTAVSSDETILTAAASAAASAGNYSITTTQLARNATSSLRSNLGSYTSSDSAINSNIDNGAAVIDRTITINTGTGGDLESVAIELTNTTTLSEFVSNFNSQSEKSNAAVVNVGTAAAPDYRVVVTSNSTGLEQGQLNITVGSEVSDPDANPLTTDGAFDNNSLSQAQNATFSISGFSGTVSRATNTVSDIFAGVTFELQAVGSANISITPDTSTSTSNLQSFVSAYNDLIEYVNENDLIVRDGSDNDQSSITFNPLATTSLDESLLSSLRDGLRGLDSSGTYGSLADLGISTLRDGTLAFDASTFADAIAADPASVASLTESLGNNLAGVNGKIAQFTRFNGIIDSARNANSSEITRLNDRIAGLEKSLLSYEASLTQQYSRFEALIGRLNSQQSTLSSALGG